MRSVLLLLSVLSIFCSTLSAETLVIRGKEKSERAGNREIHHSVSDRNLLGLERDTKFSLPKQALSGTETKVIRILAIKAQFKKEVPDNPQTTGDGTYDLRTKEQFEADEGHLIDPSPHNNEYFSAHLQALNDYYETVSNGRLSLSFEIYPQQSTAVYQLDSTMAYYGLQSPEFGLTEFFYDAFAKADEDPALQFIDGLTGEPLYDAFIVIHPGSDQQNNLPNFGQESPGDLFTGYLRLGEPFSVQNDSLLIFDGMVVPETVSQDGRVTALNAVMAHEFGHQLGLVDLYDSRTFNTAVGDFSLMDNNGFGFNVDLGQEFPVLVQGVLPIFPDAWSRAYLGFVDVVTLYSGNNIPIVAAEFDTSETQIVLVPINADEYFLIENRRTDIDGDGETALQADPVTGVILHPRSPSTPQLGNNREYDYLTPGNGMLIWHVDELAARLDYDGDGFNNFDDNDLQWFNFPSDERKWDNRHQFLTVMEADGLIEFGREYFAGYGDQADLFDINGNDELGPYTNPSSAANTGAYSGVVIDNISRALPTMTCRIRSENRTLGWPNYVGRGATPLRVYDLNGDGRDEVITSWENYILAYRFDGLPYFTPIQGNETTIERKTLYGEGIDLDTLAVFGRVAPDRKFIFALAVGDMDGDGFAEIIGCTNRFTLVMRLAKSLTYVGEAVGFETFIDEPIAVPPIILNYDTSTPDKEILVYTMTNRKIILNKFGNIIVNEPAVWPFRVLTDSLHRFELISPEGGMRANANATGIRGAAAADFDRNGTFETCEVYVDGTLKINYESNPVEINVGSGIFSEVALGDIDEDGFVEILFCGSNLIHAYDYRGVRVTDFPITVNAAHPVGPIRCSPTLVDVDGDGNMEIFVGTGTGELTGFNLKGSRLERFPAASGGNVESPAVIARNQNQAAIFSLTREGEVTAYTVSAPHEFEWNSLYGGGLNTGSYVRTLPAVQVPDAAIGYLYNYPNPATDYTTIRFSLRESGTVKLRLYNTAGDLVLESSADAIAGTDTEHLVDTSRLASGVYFCQLETNSGDRKHCSIAVLK